MGILTRFKDIMSSNINSLLDKVEDPEKMVDQYLRNLNSDLAKVKAETASIMAEEQRAKRVLDECTLEINKMESYAIKALEAGSEDDARKFLEKRTALTAKETELKEAYDLAYSNSTRMKEMHDKLVSDINGLEARKSMIKGKMFVARTQDRINKIDLSVNSANKSISAFDRMEEKANKILDEANAMAELNSTPKDDIKDLINKYDNNTNIDDELAALKEKLNK
ncbi:phage shock protein A [Clostridium tetani]|uniref:Phage shock protein A n=1 Tax=Clostridium tetani TaxID=1513 RepID=A0A4Q0VFR7_CLOTA|nr:PspA/IM30 family protein [Clostridium tetani]RXI49937.1 PspA/IM30 family protein [Clostridium tetani]BDR67648.1 phage shock protein A [Clostridium tetani]BDR73039.1 phage shock protein A [Clostridium tetani]BDR81581.1 phage shock protein A [Clostridium tetani]BDR89963.1 phage shock protein A [Clostridium tetani]